MAKFSRSGRTNPLGKREVEIKFQTTRLIADVIASGAKKAGVPVSEYVDIVLSLYHTSKDVLLASYSQQIEAIERNARESSELSSGGKSKGSVSYVRRVA